MSINLMRRHLPAGHQGACRSRQDAVDGNLKLSFVTQSTPSVDDASVVIAALKEQFSEIQGPKKDDICYATQNRQDAVKALAGQCDLVVVGSRSSSNSRRLKEVAVARGVDGYLIDGPDEIEAGWLEGKQKIGVTAGASATEILVKTVVNRIELSG